MILAEFSTMAWDVYHFLLWAKVGFYKRNDWRSMKMRIFYEWIFFFYQRTLLFGKWTIRWLSRKRRNVVIFFTNEKVDVFTSTRLIELIELIESKKTWIWVKIHLWISMARVGKWGFTIPRSANGGPGIFSNLICCKNPWKVPFFLEGHLFMDNMDIHLQFNLFIASLDQKERYMPGGSAVQKRRVKRFLFYFFGKVWRIKCADFKPESRTREMAGCVWLEALDGCNLRKFESRVAPSFIRYVQVYSIDVPNSHWLVEPKRGAWNLPLFASGFMMIDGKPLTGPTLFLPKGHCCLHHQTTIDHH